jgi:hypothetical protein
MISTVSERVDVREIVPFHQTHSSSLSTHSSFSISIATTINRKREDSQLIIERRRRGRVNGKKNYQT